MQQVKEMIKNNRFNSLMLFHGEELFMVNFYLKKVTEMIIGDGEITMNYDHFNDKKIDFETLRDSIDTLPFFADQRVVVLENLGLFEKKHSSLANELIAVLEKRPETTYVIIVEQTCDKRTKLYKSIKKVGVISEFPHLGEGELVKYIARNLGKYDKKIDSKTARYLIEHVGVQLTILHNEIEKLANYIGQESVVTISDIEQICPKSVENKIFELVDCMGTKKRARALKLYHDLLSSKEPANKVLFMLTRQFRLNYKAKLLDGEGLSANSIATRLKLQTFVAKKCLNQSKGFSLSVLEDALLACMQTEIDIRTGVFSPELAVEQLIISYSG